MDDYTGVGKSRFIVVSSETQSLFLYYLVIIVSFPMGTTVNLFCQPQYSQFCYTFPMQTQTYSSGIVILGNKLKSHKSPVIHNFIPPKHKLNAASSAIQEATQHSPIKPQLSASLHHIRTTPMHARCCNLPSYCPSPHRSQPPRLSREHKVWSLCVSYLCKLYKVVLPFSLSSFFL